MQTGKSAVESMKEKVANVGASAKSGMDKTKAVLEEKAEKLTAQHPAQKETAEVRKEEKLREAETRKQEAIRHNAATYGTAPPGPTPGVGYNPTASSPVPHGDRVEEGAVESRPIGVSTGTARPSAAHNPYVGGGGDVATGHGTGGRYN